jgi:hypothetical protein
MGTSVACCACSDWSTPILLSKGTLVSVVKNMTTAAETDRENLIKYLRGGHRVVATTPAQAVAKRDG